MNTQTRLPSEEYHRLLANIIPIIYKKGLKGTTMDFVASELGMSKRTIYEIFESKDNMLCEAFEEIGRQHEIMADNIFLEKDNVVEALIVLFRYHRDNYCQLNISFFDDLNRLYIQVKGNYIEMRRKREQKMLRIFLKGIEQGVLRSDIKYRALVKMHSIHMLALKSTRFADWDDDMTLGDVLNSMNIAFLRSIVTPEYITKLDRLLVENGFVDPVYSAQADLSTVSGIDDKQTMTDNNRQR